MPGHASSKSERGLPSSFRVLWGSFVAVILALPLAGDIASVSGLLRVGRFADAIVACDRELKAAPRSVALLTLKGLALRGAGNPTASLAALRQALALNPNYEAALQAAAQIEFEKRDPGAPRTLEYVLRLRPTSEAAHAMLAELLFEGRACERAIPHFEKSLATLQTPAFRWEYGVCLLTRERWDDAASQFSALLQLRDHAPTRYNLGLALWSAKRYPAAVDTLEPLDGPGADPDTLRLLAAALESAGQTPQSFEVLQRAIQQNPTAEALLIDLAVMCMDHQAIPLGLEVVRAGIERLPSSAKLQTLLGVLLVRSGQTADGQAAFRQAETLAPGSALGRIGLASALMQMGLASDAAQILREQLAKSGPEPKAELTLARAILLAKPSPAATREAATLLERVTRREPTQAIAHGLLGKVYFQLGDLPKATSELTTALRLDPSDRASTYQLMIVHQRSGRPAQAAELSRRVQHLLEQEKADEEAGNKFRVVRESSRSLANP